MFWLARLLDDGASQTTFGCSCLASCFIWAIYIYIYLHIYLHLRRRVAHKPTTRRYLCIPPGLLLPSVHANVDDVPRLMWHGFNGNLSRTSFGCTNHRTITCSARFVGYASANLHLISFSSFGTAGFPRRQCVASGARRPLDYTKATRSKRPETTASGGGRREREESQKTTCPSWHRYHIRTINRYFAQPPDRHGLDF